MKMDTKDLDWYEDGSFLEFDMMSIEDADGRVILEQYNKRPLSEFDHYFQEAAGDL